MVRSAGEIRRKRKPNRNRGKRKTAAPRPPPPAPRSHVCAERTDVRRERRETVRVYRVHMADSYDGTVAAHMHICGWTYVMGMLILYPLT